MIFPVLLAVAALLFADRLHAQTISGIPSAAKTDEERAASESTERLLTAALIRYARHDHVRALQMLTPLAEAGHVKAQASLGMMYSSGEGTTRNMGVAAKWLGRAADQGDVFAQLELGAIYRSGLGLPADDLLALQWFLRAAGQGSPQALNAVGEMHLGSLHVIKDYSAALKWFHEAAQFGDADALYNIGVRSALGQGVMKDDVEAYKWFDLATDAAVGPQRDRAARARIAVGDRLMPQQIWAAKMAARDWLTKNNDSFAPPVINRDAIVTLFRE